MYMCSYNNHNFGFQTIVVVVCCCFRLFSSLIFLGYTLNIYIFSELKMVKFKHWILSPKISYQMFKKSISIIFQISTAVKSCINSDYVIVYIKAKVISCDKTARL